MKKLFLLTTFTLLVVICARAQSSVITNDVFWNTADGQPIYSQGGGIFRFPDPETGEEHYYWYGVHYKEAETYRESPTGKLNGGDYTTFVSVTCYQSDDLVNWNFVGDVFKDWGYWVGRLGVAYVSDAGVYALLVQFNDRVLVATCDTPTGMFTQHNLIDMTPIIGTSNTGDQTVFTDDDGKSYLVYSYGKGRSRIYLSEIGYKDGKVGLLDCHQIYSGSGREGNCMFKYNGKYYVCASDLYGWNASNVYYLESSNIYGPYTPTNSMVVMPGSGDDYGHVTQTGFFYTVKGSKQETVIYCGDRWADFAGNGNGYNQWCPLSFVDGKPYFNSLSQWCLNAETGEWSVVEKNNYLKNGSFDADRVSIPSENKPKQAYLRGWTTEIIKGNAVAVGASDSPVLNAQNSASDRAVVVGNFCLNISDKVAFTRKVYQKISSTESVPLADGTYTMKAWVRCGSDFSELYMYADNNGNIYKCDISGSDTRWHEIEIEDIQIRDGSVEVGFFADAPADARCCVDDVVLIKKSDMDATAARLTKLGTGMLNQTLELGEAIEAFGYKWKNAEGVQVIGLPAGVTADIDSEEQTVMISGMPEETGVHEFSISTYGSTADISYKGVITVREPSVITEVAHFGFDEIMGITAKNEIYGEAEAQSVTPEWIDGVAGGAISFPGGRGYLLQSHYDELSMGRNPFSITLWFKSPGGSGVDWYLFHKGSHTANASTGATGKWIGIQYKNNNLTFAIDDNKTKTNLDVYSSNYFDNDWHFLACVRDSANSQLVLYIDGNMMGSVSDGTGDIFETEAMVIGNRNVEFDNAYKGALDELVVYTGALNATKIKELYEKRPVDGIDETTALHSKCFTVYPTVFDDGVHVVFAEVVGEMVTFSLFDVSGTKVYCCRHYVDECGVLTVGGFDNLAAGIYTLAVATADGIYTRKLIKE